MNRWIKIGIPVIIAILLVVASVGITLAVSSGNVAQASSDSYRQVSDAQFARGPWCSGCPGYGQGSGAADPDDVYIPGGATCPACPGYGQGSPGSGGTTTSRGGCCSR